MWCLNGRFYQPLAFSISSFSFLLHRTSTTPQRLQKTQPGTPSSPPYSHKPKCLSHLKVCPLTLPHPELLPSPARTLSQSSPPHHPPPHHQQRYKQRRHQGNHHGYHDHADDEGVLAFSIPVAVVGEIDRFDHGAEGRLGCCDIVVALVLPLWPGLADTGGRNQGDLMSLCMKVFELGFPWRE